MCNLKKCEFNAKTVKVLGHIISAKGISADQMKMDTITSMQKPKKMRRNSGIIFLHIINHLSKFRNNLAVESKPLRDLLHKRDKPFIHTKQSLVSSPI